VNAEIIASEVHGDARFLKGAAVVLTLLLIAAAVFTYWRAQQKPYFAELSVERLNLIEPNGLPRMIFHNSARIPGAIVRGQDQPHPNRRNTPGVLYFNDEGTENGGMLKFDMFDQDQVVALDEGLKVWDQPYIPIQEVIERAGAGLALPEGPRRTHALQELNKWAMSQGIFTQRLMVGLNRDHAAMIELADTQRRPRVRALVAPTGDARIDFLDEKGGVTRSITPRESG
jgi:hypothetical protein